MAERKRFIEQDRLTKDDGKGGKRSLYDYELFNLFLKHVEPGGGTIALRPLRASTSTYPFHYVLTEWLKSPGGGIQCLRNIYNSSGELDATLDTRIARLDTAFQRLKSAQVALLQVDPSMFEGRVHESLLMLFDRIGAGGTALTSDERLFSIYKHHEPQVHNLVLAIFSDERVGRVLPPTKIVASAIRLANARSHVNPLEGNSIPDVASFAREISSSNQELDGKRRRPLKAELDDLLLSSSASKEGKIAQCFYKLFNLIRYSDENGCGIPKVMLAELSPQLVQVLLLWTLLTQEYKQDPALQASREDAIRFVMFWRLCVIDEDKASTTCFEVLRSRTDFGPGILPEIYQTLVTKLYAWPIALPGEIDALGRHAPSPLWLKTEDRFRAIENKPVNLYRTWWESGRKFLVWLQRDYLAKNFDDFDPSSGRDDDMPYELDHICPYADWGRNWTPFRTALQNAGCLDDKEVDAMREARFVLGHSIGNFRLVGARINEGDGDAPIAIKMPYVAGGGAPSEADVLSMTDTAFSPAHRAIWLQASGQKEAVKCWDEARLKAWQQAVEERALWLYRRFYDDLGFENWR